MGGTAAMWPDPHRELTLYSGSLSRRIELDTGLSGGWAQLCAVGWTRRFLLVVKSLLVDTPEPMFSTSSISVTLVY